MFHIHSWSRWSEPERSERVEEHYGLIGSVRKPVLVIVQTRSCRSCGAVVARQSIARQIEVPEAFVRGMR